MKRYSFEPLETVARARAGVGEFLGRNRQPVGETRLVADALGTSLTQVYRWREYGVTADQADCLAVRVGLHAFEVWPELAEEAIADVSRPCDHCTCPFVPVRRDQRFCQRRCYVRWWDREIQRRRRERPELAERNRARRRRYYAENGEYERARERRRYAAKKAVA